MNGEWKLVTGRTRCTKCGVMVGTSWRFFTKPGTWTLCYCEECVEAVLGAA